MLRHALMLGLLLGGCATQSPASTSAPPCLVDLSHSYDDDTIYWPTSPSTFEKTTLSHGHTSGGYFYSAYEVATPEHGGTHLDAPIHFAEGGSTTDEVPLSRLVAPGVVIDMTESASSDRDALLGVEHIDAFEAEHGRIPRGSIVLVRTGWSKFWPDTKRYMGDDRRGDASQLHFPGISQEAAKALVDRSVGAVGIDTASLDHGPSTDFLAHRVLLGADIPGFENVMNLDSLPPTGTEIIALPMKIAGGSGGPLRIIARVPGDVCRP
jgi:kynurenine formamidase